MSIVVLRAQLRSNYQLDDELAYISGHSCTSLPSSIRSCDCSNPCLGVTLTFEFRADPWRIGSLFIERLPIPDTAAHELRPRGNCDSRNYFFREQRPQLRVVPAQIVARRVSVFSNCSAKPLEFDDQLLTR